MNDTSGPTFGTPFAYYDPASSSLKTYEDTLLSDSIPFSGRLPKWGTLHGGVLYERPTPVPRTVESDFSSLPTPTAREGKDPFIERVKHRPDDTDTLSRALAHLLPTPKATNNENRQDLAKYGPNLGMVLMPDQYTLTGESTVPQSGDGNPSPALSQTRQFTETEFGDGLTLFS